MAWPAGFQEEDFVSRFGQSPGNHGTSTSGTHLKMPNHSLWPIFGVWISYDDEIEGRLILHRADEMFVVRLIEPKSDVDPRGQEEAGG